jgi:RimJ/RimL family protein N-acetyltransferase
VNIYLETKRLILREMTEDDAELLFALDSDPEVTRYIRSHRFTDAASFRLDDANAYRERVRTTYMAYYEKRNGHGYWATLEKGGGAFVGWFHLRPGPDYRFAKEAGYCDGDLDLGYRLHKEFWGKGYATEGSGALIRKAFLELGADRVVATALVANVASTRVMEKVGMTRDREVALPGFDEPAVTYAIDVHAFQASPHR